MSEPAGDPLDVPFLHRRPVTQVPTVPRPRRPVRVREPEPTALRNRRAVNWHTVARSIAGAVLVVEILRVAFFSPRLGLAAIRIEGSTRLTQEEVLRETGLEPGRNLFSISLARVSRVLLRKPYLKKAIVTRGLPDTLVLTLTERVPALQITSPDLPPGTARIADEAGLVFDMTDRLSAELPLVDVSARRLPPMGHSLAATELEMARECTRLAAAEHVTVRRVRVDDRGELWLNILSPPGEGSEGAGLLVRVGRGTELPEKFRDIRQVLQGWPSLPEKAEYLNVMCAGRPALKLLAANTTSP